jgi:hypothetical protein
MKVFVATYFCSYFYEFLSVANTVNGPDWLHRVNELLRRPIQAGIIPLVPDNATNSSAVPFTVKLLPGLQVDGTWNVPTTLTFVSCVHKA